MRFLCYSPDGKQEMLISEQHFNKYKKPNGWLKEKPTPKVEKPKADKPKAKPKKKNDNKD